MATNRFYRKITYDIKLKNTNISEQKALQIKVIYRILHDDMQNLNVFQKTVFQ